MTENNCYISPFGRTNNQFDQSVALLNQLILLTRTSLYSVDYKTVIVAAITLSSLPSSTSRILSLRNTTSVVRFLVLSAVQIQC